MSESGFWIHCPVLKKFGLEKTLTSKIKAELLVQSGARWLGVALDLVGSVIVFSSVLSCLIAFDNAGETLGLALNYSLQVPIYLAWVIKFMTDLESCFNSVERVIEYSELDKENIVNEDDDANDNENITDIGIEDLDLKFDNVGLSHGDSFRPVVHGLNFEIPKGQKLAIVGMYKIFEENSYCDHKILFSKY